MKNHSNSKTGRRSKVDNLTLVNSPTTNPPNIGEASMSWIQLVTHHWKNQVRSPEVSIHWSENFKFMIFGISNQYSHELDAGHVSHDLVLGLGNIFQLGVWENRVHHTVPFKSNVHGLAAKDVFFPWWRLVGQALSHVDFPAQPCRPWRVFHLKVDMCQIISFCVHMLPKSIMFVLQKYLVHQPRGRLLWLTTAW